MARKSAGPVRNPFTGKRYGSEEAAIAAMERDNADQLERLGVTAAQAIFNVRNRYPVGQTHGRSVLSGRPTEWNAKARRYERFADDKEREAYRQSFLDRMKRVHGKEHLLDDPVQQRKMLAGRSISGEYAFQDGSKKTYTGKQELALLQFLDVALDWPGEDVQCPAPQAIEYTNPRSGQKSFYLPDVWIESLNLIIEVKGELHQGYRIRDIDIERAKDEVLGTSGYEYVKVEDGEFSELLEKLADLRGGEEDSRPNPGRALPLSRAALLGESAPLGEDALYYLQPDGTWAKGGDGRSKGKTRAEVEAIKGKIDETSISGVAPVSSTSTNAVTPAMPSTGIVDLLRAPARRKGPRMTASERWEHQKRLKPWKYGEAALTERVDEGTFTHEGHFYRLQGLIDATEGRPTTEFRVSDLAWVIKYSPPDEERLKTADRTKPIIVIRSKGRLVVIDGLHRLVNAKRRGDRTIAGVLVTDEDIRPFLLKRDYVHEQYYVPLPGDALTERVGHSPGDFERSIDLALGDYRRKRDLSRTPEPAGRRKKGSKPIFVVQRHDASHLHFDFRIEVGGVLKSWAVPKGPSATEKRLAVRTEDHPLEYAEFEGTIPPGNYGAGTVEIWDRGEFVPEKDPEEGLRRGHLTFVLKGKEMTGRWALIHTGGKNWLLLKTKSDGPGPLDEETLHEAQKGADSFQLPTQVDTPPDGDGWLHELKIDGIRVKVRLSHGSARIETRGGEDWTGRFPKLARDIGKYVRCASAVLDGEVGVPNEQGVADYAAFQGAVASSDTSDAVFYAFDLLELNGADTRSMPLQQRVERLDAIIPSKRGIVQRPMRFPVGGAALRSRVASMKAEGTVSKRLDAPYSEGRSRDWLKVKLLNQQEFVVVGFTTPKGSRESLGSLLLAVNDGGRLRYVGKVGTGFDRATLRYLEGLLLPIATDEGFLPDDPKEPSVTWVRPQYVAEVRFLGWTRDGMVRQGSFQGLRYDKDPSEVVRESALLEVTNPDRVMFPGSGMTKGQLAEYYQEVAEAMLPFVANRPLVIWRHPKGVHQQGFVQRNYTKGLPEGLHQTPGGLLYVTDAQGLLAAVQMGAVEFHTWNCTVDNLDRPDRLIVDLDPGEGATWAEVARAASAVRAELKRDGLASFPLGTGSLGLHVVVPLERGATWEQLLAYSKSVADRLAKADPDLFTTSHLSKDRRGRVYLDVMRNAKGASSVAPLSTRATPEGTVAVPLSWSEVAQYKPGRASARAAARTEAWSAMAGTRQGLPGGA